MPCSTSTIRPPPAHFHKVWFDAAAHARTLPPVGHPAHRGLVRALRGMPEPGIVANATARPACSVAMVGGDPPDAKPFLRVQLGRVAFEIRDFAAYRSCLGAFRQAHHMARDVFLPAGQRTGLQRRAHRRPRRLLPPHPRRPGPSSEPTGHGTGPPGRAGDRPQRTHHPRRPATRPGRRVPPDPAEIIGERTDRMSTPDYPLLTVPGYELYQLAHLTTFVVDALARHRRAAEARDHPGRRAAAAVEIPTDAADAGPARATASPGGFPAAATALPSPGTTPPHSPARTRRDRHCSPTWRPCRCAASAVLPADARSVGASRIAEFASSRSGVRFPSAPPQVIRNRLGPAGQRAPGNGPLVADDAAGCTCDQRRPVGDDSGRGVAGEVEQRCDEDEDAPGEKPGVERGPAVDGQQRGQAGRELDVAPADRVG